MALSRYPPTLCPNNSRSRGSRTQSSALSSSTSAIRKRALSPTPNRTATFPTPDHPPEVGTSTLADPRNYHGAFFATRRTDQSPGNVPHEIRRLAGTLTTRRSARSGFGRPGPAGDPKRAEGAGQADRHRPGALILQEAQAHRSVPRLERGGRRWGVASPVAWYERRLDHMRDVRDNRALGLNSPPVFASAPWAPGGRPSRTGAGQGPGVAAPTGRSRPDLLLPVEAHGPARVRRVGSTWTDGRGRPAGHDRAPGGPHRRPATGAARPLRFRRPS